MTARLLTPLAVLVAAVVVLVLVVSGGDDHRYEFKLELANALGLRDGSLVTVGGVEVGKVKVKLEKDKGDKVLVTARLDDGQGPIGAGARAYITSVNLLGQKRLELDKGRLADPQPSGTRIDASRVTPSTDLDQVLAVLTPDVRARLNILLNEAGATVVGRGTDLSRLIETLPGTIDKATAVVDKVVGDNHTLGDLVAKSDGLVRDVTAERGALTDLIDSAGQAAGSAATKRAQLRATLAQAPGTLTELRSFLAKLQQTTVPLGPAARDITATAPELLSTIDEVAPFQRAAAPTLAKAQTVAPSLTRLATGATPVLRRAVPTLKLLAAFASDLVPVTDTLNSSVDNLVGTVDNWSRAVQYRDGLSHIFRGEAAVTPQTLEGVLNRYLGTTSPLRKGRPAKGGKATTPSLPTLPQLAPKAPTVDPKRLVPPVVGKALDDAVGTVDSIVGSITGTSSPKQGSGPASAQDLLDYLLKP
jgi:phospholipid/cholesterol/gamma-HCH transport system substrate-binding protein